MSSEQSEESFPTFVETDCPKCAKKLMGCLDWYIYCPACGCVFHIKAAQEGEGENPGNPGGG